MAGQRKNRRRGRGVLEAGVQLSQNERESSMEERPGEALPPGLLRGCICVRRERPQKKVGKV